MCQPLPQIRNPLQPRLDVPPQFCKLKDEEEAVTYLPFPAESLEPLKQLFKITAQKKAFSPTLAKISYTITIHYTSGVKNKEIPTELLHI